MRRCIILALWLWAGTSWAATDVNQASEAELDGLKGIGPALSGKILEARQQGPFTSWQDLMQRVKGIQPKSAARLSEAGLSVNGIRYPGTPGQSQQPTSAQ